MTGTALRKPGRNAAIAAAITLSGIVAVIWGIMTMRANDGEETNATAGAIGVGGAVAVFGAIVLLNFVRGMREFRAFEAGEGVIAQWRVSREELEAFRSNDDARNALGVQYHNDYALPAELPADGLTVVFREDGVMIGDTYVGLSAAGLFRFYGVQMLPEWPLTIEFGLASTTASSGASAAIIHSDTSALRVPVAMLAHDQAARVLQHFERVASGEVRVRPERYKRFILGAFIAGLMCAAAGAAGYFNVPPTSVDTQVTLLVLGAVGAPGCLIVMLVVWLAAKATGQAGR